MGNISVHDMSLLGSSPPLLRARNTARCTSRAAFERLVVLGDVRIGGHRKAAKKCELPDFQNTWNSAREPTYLFLRMVWQTPYSHVPRGEACS
jgi:hypothetical protein